MRDRQGHPRGSGPASGDAEPAAESPYPKPMHGTPTYEELSTQLEIAKGLAAEHLASLQRTAADFANFKRRTSEDRERELGLASESLLRKLLSVADDFDRALEAMPEDL